MTRSWSLGLVSGAVAAAAILTLGGRLSAQGAPATTGRVAVVSVGRLMTEYQRMKDFTEELKQAEERLESENQERKNAIDMMRKTAEHLADNDPTLVTKMNELLEAQIEHRTWFEVKQASVTREIAVATDRIYRDIVNTTSEVAQAAGYDVVFHRDQYRPQMDPEEIQAQILARKVIYANEGADITQLVLDKLNQDYRAKPQTPQLQLP